MNQSFFYDQDFAARVLKMQNYEPQFGDIAACWGDDLQSKIITLGTARLWAPAGLRLGPSHVAIMANAPGKTEMLWNESTTNCVRECLVAKKHQSGVQVHAIAGRMRDYIYHNGRIEIFRLTDPTLITEEDRKYFVLKMADYLVEQVPYDMCGAIISGLRVTSRLLHCLGCDREHLFCSDMIAGLLMRIGLMGLSDPDHFTPAGLLRYLVNRGLYERHIKI
ncbi:hypothetical protein [Rubinisphaera italica]|uniref:Uncharacterized protein n=1 Tax=Rubinisphaera italica TaxID=2527969 RepID=A0A5C5XJM9_9PLAN|nr:hypothetical protein [Rubinisphaera italica]TWT63180.1 hypothetical protein Pan54_39330 [Rubinisphaera italica]